MSEKTTYQSSACAFSAFLARLLLLACFGVSSVHAFDPSKVPDGLYYNGSDINLQLWTPLVLAKDGKLIDPFVYAQQSGVKALEGFGNTKTMLARGAFIYRMCAIDEVRLGQSRRLAADHDTYFVSQFVGKDCGRKHEWAMENFLPPPARKNDNPFPTFFLNQTSSALLPTQWIYGAPGALIGERVPIRTWSEVELGGRPPVINGSVTRMFFLPLPVIEPNLYQIALETKIRIPEYPVSVVEASHRAARVVLNRQLYLDLHQKLRDRLMPRYLPRLQQAIGNKFGGVLRTEFELGAVQGVDIDNQTSFDYAGVVRISAYTRDGQHRWVDVVYCWRKGDDSLQVIATSEDALYDPRNGFFSERNPFMNSPTLILSGFMDLDKDKKMEVVTVLSTPVGFLVRGRNEPVEEPLAMRRSAVYAWSRTSAGIAWREVFRTVEHEERETFADPAQVTIRRLGQ
jgi:hypothetical protein